MWGIHPPKQTAIVAAVCDSAVELAPDSSRVKVAGYSPARPPGQKNSADFFRLVNRRSRLVEPAALLLQHGLLQLVAGELHAEAHIARHLVRHFMR